MRNASPRRGLHSMRSRTTRKATASQTSPELYLKLTSLEIERSRRLNELENLKVRMQTLCERIQSISDEQADLRGRLDTWQPEPNLSQPHLIKQNNNVGLTY
jgi:predicted nuclease with TOPRIM domain